MFGRKKKEKIEKPIVIQKIELSKEPGLQTIKVERMVSIAGVLSHGDKIYLLVNTRLGIKESEWEFPVFVTEDTNPTGEGKYIGSVVADNRIYHVKKTDYWTPGELP